MVLHLKETQRSLNITDRDVRCVTLAGLCHDLGHGPFSHVFDSQFIPRARFDSSLSCILLCSRQLTRLICRPDRKWQHEDASESMFDYLLEENDDIELPPQDAEFIKDLITGIDRHPENKEKRFLFQIVANKQNGIDVDKFDYMARDTHQIGDKCNLSALRLIRSSRVIADQICYSDKDITNVFLLFQERWSLHKRGRPNYVKLRQWLIMSMFAVYSHKTGNDTHQVGFVTTR